ncbi:TraR/DksA C4-type zinc finger protein [Pseudalkalibacillus caeni]|uniref:YteA family sporulation protein n=1 Tax=Exobacillus caeni TaxID=2574798 RepID=A0A5R9FCC5_9BACL|nr:TraR/DksA C4-type zinc finger protein [Pseudalkalibacillus caeni]TLS38204.1 yteA family sporulation protein [Pseudalkalibacillus caeni]
MLTSNQLQQFKNQLEKAKQELYDRLEANDHFDLEKAYINETMGELSNYDNHPADNATALFEREKDVALNEHLEKELKDINEALGRIENGTYGRCEVCRQPIAIERLEALPTTTHCKKDSPDQFVSLKRPVEEDILRPAFGEFEYDELDATFFDAEDSWQSVAFYGTSDTPSDFFAQSKLKYEDMYIEAEEPVGFVEDIEAFLTSDIDGEPSGVAYNFYHQQYEDQLDANDAMSVVGNLGNPEIEGIE